MVTLSDEMIARMVVWELVNIDRGYSREEMKDYVVENLCGQTYRVEVTMVRVFDTGEEREEIIKAKVSPARSLSEDIEWEIRFEREKELSRCIAPDPREENVSSIHKSWVLSGVYFKRNTTE